MQVSNSARFSWLENQTHRAVGYHRRLLHSTKNSVERMLPIMGVRLVFP